MQRGLKPWPSDTADRETARRLLISIIDRACVPMVFQPIVDLDKRHVVGFEALARFPNATAIGSPEPWFAFAHELDIGVELELAAARSALRALAATPDGLYISVNVSPAAITSEQLLRLLADSGIAPRVVLELTEHVHIDDYDAFLEGVAEIRSIGTRLAVDDAGAGYASLQHIVRLSPDLIKLDRSLVQGVDGDPVRRALMIALVAFATDIRVGLAAEGVETFDEAEALWEWGIGYGQGFLFGRPAPEISAQIVRQTERQPIFPGVDR